MTNVELMPGVEEMHFSHAHQMEIVDRPETFDADPAKHHLGGVALRAVCNLFTHVRHEVPSSHFRTTPTEYMDLPRSYYPPSWLRMP